MIINNVVLSSHQISAAATTTSLLLLLSLFFAANWFLLLSQLYLFIHSTAKQTEPIGISLQLYYLITNCRYRFFFFQLIKVYHLLYENVWSDLFQEFRSTWSCATSSMPSEQLIIIIIQPKNNNNLFIYFLVCFHDTHLLIQKMQSFKVNKCYSLKIDIIKSKPNKKLLNLKEKKILTWKVNSH